MDIDRLVGTTYRVEDKKPHIEILNNETLTKHYETLWTKFQFARSTKRREDPLSIFSPT